MRNAMTSIAIAAMILAAGGLADANTKPKKAANTTTSSAESLTAEQVVAKHIEALGGADVLRATRTMKYTIVENRGGDKTVRTVWRARPNKMRVEVTEGDTVTVKGFDGSRGWVRKGAAAVEPMPADKLDGMKAMAEFDDALLDYAGKGHKVTLVGTAEVNGATTYELAITLKSGESEKRWIDAKSFMELKRGWSYTHEGKSTEKAIFFGDYKKVGGQMVNHSLENEYDGKKVKMIVTDIAFDRPFEDSLFSAPKK